MCGLNCENKMKTKNIQLIKIKNKNNKKKQQKEKIITKT